MQNNNEQKSNIRNSSCSCCCRCDCSCCRIFLMKWIKQNKIDLLCFVFSGIVYCLNKLILIDNSKGAIHYFLMCYLNDLMAPIFVLAISSMIFQCIGYELNRFSVIMAIGLFAALIWEFVIPMFKAESVTDPIDFLCYIIGAGVFYLIKRLDCIYFS